MGRRNIPQHQIIAYAQARQTMSRAAAAKAAGISYNTATSIDRGEGLHAKVAKNVTSQMSAARELADNPPKSRAELTPEALRALDDFGFWRRRYLGRLSTPWQEDAAYKVIEWLHSEDKEYVVVNAPPGSGKSTLFTHDIPAWLACRDRGIRCLVGSRTERQAKQYVGRLRRTFDRRRPVQADPNELALGLAADAEATLIDDFGRFKPLLADLWRMDEFVLAQLDEQLLEDKEPSFAAYGMDSGFLGSRANLVIWDDLADKCLPGHVTLSMHDGTHKRVDEIQEYDLLLPTADGANELRNRVVAIEDNGIQPIYRITTTSGRRLDCTANHPVLTPEGWVRADELLPGHGLKVAVRYTLHAADPLTDDAWMLGVMVGDGCLTSGNCSLAVSDPEIKERATKIAQDKGWGVREYPGQIKFSKGARQFFREHGMEGKGSWTKRVPDAIKRADAMTRRAFLSGYLDADGSVDSRRSFGISFVSVSRDLLCDVQDLLARDDISSTLAERSGTYKAERRPSWHLRIGTAGAGKAARVLSPVCARKAALLDLGVDRGTTEWGVTDAVAKIEVLDPQPTFAIQTTQGIIVAEGLVTHNTTMRTAEAREGIRTWWDDEAETRLEPGGLLVLQGQRMGPEDIYRHALDQRLGEEDDEPTDGEDDRPQKYRHVIYKAHDDSRCTNVHGKDSPYWPDGCLLDPRRLPWSGSGGLRTIRSNREDKFRVLYQQEDLDPASVLVNPMWVTGGMSVDGEMFPGCRDERRGLCELPHESLHGRLISVATADPSPTKYWGVQWWIVRVTDDGPQERYLMDLLKETLDAPDFLDWNHATNSWTGVMEQWQKRSADLGLPITTWIVEANAAQRFLLQFEHVKRWMAARRVTVRAHQTHRNKADPDFGVETIAPHYRYGRVRLPWRDGAARLKSMSLIEEVTRWPEGRSDDEVMAHWFLEWQLPSLWQRNQHQPRAKRPSWLTKEPALTGWVA